MNLSQSAGSTGLSAITALLNSGTLVAYQGAIPASPETALSGQTSLATWTFATTAFGTPTYGSGYETATASFTSASESPTVNGTACFARLFESNGTSVVMDITIAAPWQASTAVIVGQYVTNGGNLYVCATAGTTASTGGPTGTGTGITDGTAAWNYVKAGSADMTVGSTTFSTGTSVDISSLTMSIPVV